MYCRHCGSPVADTAKFCGNCGAPTAEDFPATVADAAAVEPPDLGTLKLTRNKVFLGSAALVYIYIDGESRGAMKNGEVLSMTLPAGEHQLVLNVVGGGIDKKATAYVTIAAGDTVSYTYQLKSGFLPGYVGKAPAAFGTVTEPTQTRAVTSADAVSPGPSALTTPRGRPLERYKYQLMGGLGLPEGTQCTISLYPDQLLISALGQDFHIPAGKVIDASLNTAKEIQKQYVSSLGGAIAGALLLGPIGAVLGGSASQRTIKKNTNMMIFTYLTDTGTNYIIFDAGKATVPARKLSLIHI